MLGLKVVPELYVGPWDQEKIEIVRLMDLSKFGYEREGFVVRIHGQFHFDGFGLNVAKWVRSGHVQTGEHWLKYPIVVNQRSNYPAAQKRLEMYGRE